MANTSTIDLKFYWAVFLRRLPYFLVVAALFTAAGATVAMVLPAVYRSTASILVEPQQIPDQLAETTVANNPFQQAQIIEQRLMTRANLLELANRLGLYKNLPEPMSANAIVGDMRERIEFIGFIPDVTQMRGIPGATILGVAFEAETAEMALKGSNELVNLVLQENVRLRTGRAGDTLEFFSTEVDRLSQALETQAARIAEFKTAHVSALPDSMDSRRAQQEREQQRLLDLEREEAQLRNQRATVEWVYQRTGRAQGLAATTPEEDELQRLQGELLQAQAIYKATSPQVRILQNRIAALQGLVDQQRAARAVPDADGNAAQPLTELDAELAPIDDRLKFIADEKATIQGNLSTLDSSIQETPENEMVLSGLERELTALQEQYKAAVASRSQAQTGERIEVLSKGERFSLIEQPILPTRPARPARKLIAAAGLVGGVGAGVVLVFLMEMLNRSIRRPVDLTNRLGIQPFATLPYIRTREEIRWKRGVIGGVLVSILAAIPLVLYFLLAPPADAPDADGTPPAAAPANPA